MCIASLLNRRYLQVSGSARVRVRVSVSVTAIGLGLPLWLQLGIGIGFRRNHSWSSIFTPIGVTIASALPLCKCKLMYND